MTIQDLKNAIAENKWDVVNVAINIDGCMYETTIYKRELEDGESKIQFIDTNTFIDDDTRSIYGCSTRTIKSKNLIKYLNKYKGRLQ